MDPNTRALMMGAAGSGGAEKIYIEDTFSTFLYTGNGSTQTITNGIDLSGKGGLVWFKQRNNSSSHELVDTARGVGKGLNTRTDGAQTSLTDLTSFASSGFSLGYNTGNANFNTGTFASWAFRKQAKFFDVVTYTGTGSNRTIAHSLGSVPGCIIVKRTDTTGDWQLYHRSLANTEYMVLNSSAAKATGVTRWNSTTPTSTEFSLGTDATVNASGGTYVAYLFAHDAGGFGDSGNDNVISCGSYTGNGSTSGPTINLGWEPQWLVVKRASGGTGGWEMIDNMRGFVAGGNDAILYADLSNAEAASDRVSPTGTGFQVTTASTALNNSGDTYIYIAIRRGPMKTPTDATKVFQAKVYTGTNTDNRLVTTDIVTDMAWARQRDGSTQAIVVADRLRGQPYLRTNSTGIEINDANSFDQELVGGTEYGTAFSSMSGFWIGNDGTSNINVSTTSNGHIAYAFRRAPGFFDVVAYTGTGVARTVSHNLGVVPELMVVKRRTTSANSWAIYTSNLGATQYLSFDAAAGAATLSTVWNDTQPTASQFTVGTLGWVNASNNDYIAYLFATCPGVSKVGSYTGTGTTLNVDCGFTNGARFVMIKRTDTTGDWYVWDTARGIVSANDPYLLLNSNAAEVTSTDYIDPLNSGFQISSTAPAAINANSGTFIYLAIA